MSKSARILGAVAVGALLVVGLALGAALEHDEAPVTATGKAADGITRIAFLDLPGARPDALLLHAPATGRGLRAVTDAAALDAARGAAFDDRRDAPPDGQPLEATPHATTGEAPRGAPFVTLLLGGEVLQVFHCEASPCAAQGMEGLLVASHPVTRITETFPHHDLARKRHWKLLGDPSVVLVSPPDLPAPSSIVYPARVMLDLPTIVLAPGDRDSFDEGLYRARFHAAFAHAFPDGESYRLGRISFHETTQAGRLLLEPAIAIEVIPGLAAHLLDAPAPLAEMPAFTPLPTTEPASDPPDAAGLPVPSVDAIGLREMPPVTYTLSYYRIAPDEPSLQQ